MWGREVTIKLLLIIIFFWREGTHFSCRQTTKNLNKLNCFSTTHAAPRKTYGLFILTCNKKHHLV